MSTERIDFEDKEGLIPKEIHVNQVWDTDINKLKSVINNNADELDTTVSKVDNLEENQVTGVEVYETLVSLPVTGTLLVSYKVANDGTSSNNGYYHWDGGAYVKDASLFIGEVAEGNVDGVEGGKIYNEILKKSTEPLKYKAELEVISNNLFNKETRVDGFHVDENQGGILVIDASKLTSDFIRISELTDYSCLGSQFACYYDSDFNFVAGGWRNVTTTSFNTVVGATYIRMSFNVVSANEAQVNIGTTLLNYDAYVLNVVDAQLSKIYDKIKEEKLIVNENDWYDPNFINQYTISTSASVDAYTQDFRFNANSILILRPDFFDTYNTMMYQTQTTNLTELNPSFSKVFFAELGYEVGDELKIGFWYKIPDATLVQTRRLYAGGTIVESPITIMDSEWKWFESASDFIVNTDDWQSFELGLRDMLVGERAYIRGLTLTNITKDTWIGERNSSQIQTGQEKEIINLYPYPKNIYTENWALNDTSDQNSTPFTRSVVPITTPITADAFQFVGSDATQIRLNFRHIISSNAPDWGKDKLLLPQLKEDAYFKIGFWVKLSGDFSTNDLRFINDDLATNGKLTYYRNLDTDVWYFVSSMPMFFSASTYKDLDETYAQINCTPNSGAITIQISGLTYTLNDNPLGFRDEINITRASKNRFTNTIYTSYGDSISAFEKYQTFMNANIASDNRYRAIGGTTVANKETIAYVDSDGGYLDRPISEGGGGVPPGTEGIDYFTIESSMCRQERVDTIQLTTQFFTMMGGANDWASDVVLGNIGDVASDVVAATFYASYKSALNKIFARIPNAYVALLNLSHREDEATAANGNGVFYFEFRKAINDIAELYGIPVIDTNDIGVNDINWNSYSADDVHPNGIMFRLIADRIVRDLNSYQEYDQIKEI